MLRKSSVIKIAILVVVILVFRAYSRPITGRVVDFDTGRPIKGVAVIALWKARYVAGPGADYRINNTKEVITDDEGRFRVPFESGLYIPILYQSNNNPIIYFFKPGYGDTNIIYEPKYHFTSTPHYGREDFHGKETIIKLVALKDKDERCRYKDDFEPLYMDETIQKAFPVYNDYYKSEKKECEERLKGYYRKDWRTSALSVLVSGEITMLRRDRNNPNIIYSISGYNNGMLYISLDGGNNWERIAEEYSLDSIVCDNRGTLYGSINYDSLIRSKDNGLNWELNQHAAYSDLSIEIIEPLIDGTLLLASKKQVFKLNEWSDTVQAHAVGQWSQQSPIFSMLLSRKGIIYIGTFSGLYKSLDSGETWLPCKGIIMTRRVFCLIEDMRGNLFAGTNYGLYKSDDMGDTWEDYGLKYLTRPINDLLIDSAGVIYVTTRDGVYVKEKANTDWKPYWRTFDPWAKHLCPKDNDEILVGTDLGLFKLPLYYNASDSLKRTLDEKGCN